ncbi:MAG: nucleotidyl transferase [Candidatus Syntrophoarchaeum sp. WYZ-LMO15]|nr:MAG: nucleotidyl transferase [Candidatus Syntrophoarchaeum sp. WYZ-LMO15]
MIQQAVILAAGEGQRLRPFTARKPKVMIRVSNRPILEYVIDALREAGILDIIIVAGYRKERIIDYFGDGSSFGLKIRYVTQSPQLGTAHALKQARNLVEGEFLLLPGDNIIDKRSVSCASRPWCLVYKRLGEVSKYGAVLLEDGRVKSINEKPGEDVSHLANTGIYALTDEIFEMIGDETSLVAVINSIAGDVEIRGVETTGIWMDIVYPWDIIRVNERAMLFSGKSVAGKVEENTTLIGKIKIGENTIIRGNTYIRGPVIIGSGCEIGPNAVIMPSTSIGDNVKIGSLSYIADSVINEGVMISAGCFIESSVIERGCIIGHGFTAGRGMADIKVAGEFHTTETGVFIGEDCTIGANVVAKPGTLLGNGSKVAPLTLLSGVIPDGSKVL